MVKDIYVQSLPQKGNKLPGMPAENSLIHSFNFHSHLWKSPQMHANGLLIMLSGREQVEIVPKTANQETEYVCRLLLNEIMSQNKDCVCSPGLKDAFTHPIKALGSRQPRAPQCFHFFSQKTQQRCSYRKPPRGSLRYEI